MLDRALRGDTVTYFAGWADEPISASVEAATELIGGYVEAGATDFTFYLHKPAEPVLDDFVTAHRSHERCSGVREDVASGMGGARAVG